MSLGPAGEILRLAGDAAAHLRGRVEQELRDGLGQLEQRSDGIYGGASTWVVTARAPS